MQPSAPTASQPADPPAPQQLAPTASRHCLLCDPVGPELVGTERYKQIEGRGLYVVRYVTETSLQVIREADVADIEDIMLPPHLQHRLPREPSVTPVQKPEASVRASHTSAHQDAGRYTWGFSHRQPGATAG
jgi:hypothetical protein